MNKDKNAVISHDRRGSYFDENDPGTERNGLGGSYLTKNEPELEKISSYGAYLAKNEPKLDKTSDWRGIFGQE